MSGALPRDNNDMRVAPKIAEVITCITCLILAQMEQVRSPSACTKILDVDGMVTC